MALVDILLASYNGSKYIESQILSIIGQRFRDWRLIVHDDGSDDDTLKIIRYWANVDGRIHLVEDGIVLGSAKANFMHLLSCSDAQYVMFADQDDIWFDNKIGLLYEEIHNKSTNIPQVVYSNSYIWKEKDGIQGLATHTFPKKINHFLFLNSGMQGCVAIFNDEMKKAMLKWEGDCAMHDHLLHLIGMTFGEVQYINLPLMLYRNHDNNVTGGTTANIYDVNQLMLSNKSIPVVDKNHYDAVVKFMDLFEKEINENDKKIISEYIKLVSKGTMKKIIAVICFDLKVFDSKIRLIVKMLLRPYIR